MGDSYRKYTVTHPGDPDKPTRTVTFPPPGPGIYTHAVIGGETELVIHGDGTSELRSSGLVIELGEEDG